MLLLEMGLLLQMGGCYRRGSSVVRLSRRLRLSLSLSLSLLMEHVLELSLMICQLRLQLMMQTFGIPPDLVLIFPVADLVVVLWLRFLHLVVQVLLGSLVLVVDNILAMILVACFSGLDLCFLDLLQLLLLGLVVRSHHWRKTLSQLCSQLELIHADRRSRLWPIWTRLLARLLCLLWLLSVAGLLITRLCAIEPSSVAGLNTR